MLGLTATPTASLPALDSHWETDCAGHVISLEWSPGGTCLAAATADGPIYVLDADTGRKRARLTGHKNGTSKVAWNAGDSVHSGVLASAGHDGMVRIWNASSATELLALEAEGAWVEGVAWSPKGYYLAASAGRKLKLWDFRNSAEAGKMLQSFPAQ